MGQNRVAIVKISGLDICRDIYIGRHTRLPATKAQNAFWDFVTSIAPIKNTYI
jgi:hypothetical protein